MSIAVRNERFILTAEVLSERILSVFADEGIYQKAGAPFWNTAVTGMLQHFNMNDYGKGIAFVVTEIGNTLQTHFPYASSTDKNELPDDIVFGK